VFATRSGTGPKVLLVHGLGSRSGTWATITGALAEQREVIAVDLPGHGRTPAPPGPATFATLVEAVAAFLDDEGLQEVDLVGSSIGGRVVLELARRGLGGTVVALDPGGFWKGPGATYLRLTLGGSIRVARTIRPHLRTLTGNPVTRSVLFVQLSARPWRLDPAVASLEMESYADTKVFGEVLRDIVRGPPQPGLRAGAPPRRIALVWGREDRVTLPRQAGRAVERFPGAELHWLDRCGHLPHLDQPAATARLILHATAER
jgi:pimeloyl-ACP methyl ester carboxylesterase